MKSKKILTILVLALSLMLCAARVSGQIPLTTAFTYQGFLTENGRIVRGTYDLQFRLFDADLYGGEVGKVDVNDFEVIDGHIVVELDFGGDVFDGDRRWLETAIRPGKSNDPCDFVTLAPRLELTLTPYALYALNAEDANTVGGHDANNLPYVGGGGTVNHIPVFTDANTLGHSVIHQSAGNIGIGTTSPTEKLEVNGDIKVKNITLSSSDVRDNESINLIVDRNNDSVTEALIVRHNGDTGPELFRIQEDGNVGIGTTNPGTRLEVAGQVRITGGNPGADRVLTSDASGLASWQAPPDTGLPQGVIVMWSGAIGNIPTGWALCDGGVHNGVQTPDLRDMFIVGAGSNYNIGDTGGEARYTLTIAEIPPHTHSALTTEKHVGDADAHSYDMYKCQSGGTTSSTGGGQPHENRPPFFALAYIMFIGQQN